MIDLDRDLEYLVGRIDLWKEYRNDEVLEDALEEIYHILSTINDAMKQDNEEILHDRPHKEVGEYRAAKVHRVPTADEIVSEQQMTAPTKIEWSVDGHYLVPPWEKSK